MKPFVIFYSLVCHLAVYGQSTGQFDFTDVKMKVDSIVKIINGSATTSVYSANGIAKIGGTYKADCFGKPGTAGIQKIYCSFVNDTSLNCSFFYASDSLIRIDSPKNRYYPIAKKLFNIHGSLADTDISKDYLELGKFIYKFANEEK